jgi:uncharacterized protein
MEKLTAIISGLLFGAGVTVSGMVNPQKVLNFLDIAGNWDPSLIFVMAAGLAVALIGYRFIFKRSAPLFAASFHLPTSKDIDGKLVLGAACFGMGWGMSGLCPGPAIASIVFGRSETFLFVVAMAGGMVLAKFAQSRFALT